MLVALSGYGASRHPSSADAGFDAWLVKPIEGETLRRLILERPSSKEVFALQRSDVFSG